MGRCRPIAAHFTRLAIFHYLPLNGNTADNVDFQHRWTTKGHFHSISLNNSLEKKAINSLDEFD